MKMKQVVINEPKSRKAALNLVTQIETQIKNIEEREGNIMRNKSNTEAKIEKLQETLKDYSHQLEVLKGTKGQWQEEIKRLKLQFSLTESEILELRSQLLRSAISRTEAELEMLEDGETIDV